MYRLHFFKVSPNTAELRFSRIWRFIFAGIAALFASLSLFEGAPVWPAIVLASVSLVSALYTENWVFDLSGEQQVTRKIGVWPFLKTVSFPISDITSVAMHASKPLVSRGGSDESSVNRMPRLPHGERQFIKLLIMRKDHAPVAVHTDLSRDGSRIIEMGKLIASFLHVPFTEQLE